MTTPQGFSHENDVNPSEAPTVREYAAHYQQAYPQLTAVAAGVLGRREGAEDIVQEAARIATSKRVGFANPQSFLAWMFGAVRRCAQNERRKLHRRRNFATDPVEMAGLLERPEAEPLPFDVASGRLVDGQTSFEDLLQHALEELNETARCCLLLRTVHDLSYAEIAELLGIPRGTAMSHVHRSRRQLRSRLGGSGLAGDIESPSQPSRRDESS